jgi:hypothetical protein
MSAAAALIGRTAREHKYLARLVVDSRLVNLSGNYDYLELPYYISQDAEIEGLDILPTCKEMIDAYVPPLFLEKAKRSGLPVPEYYLSNGYFEPPVIIDPINPFMIRSKVVRAGSRRNGIARSMTRNFKYAMCCQELPPNVRIVKFRSVLGWSILPKYRKYASQVWSAFHIPLALVRLVMLPDDTVLFSDISPLPFSELKPRETDYIGRNVEWGK